MRTRHRNRWLLSVLVSLCLTLCACSSGSNAPAPDPKPSGTEDTASSGGRDATPQVLTPAIRNLIREGKVHQIDGIIYTSAAENMIAMDTSIYNLFKEGVIDRHTAVAEAVNPEIMAKRLNLN